MLSESELKNLTESNKLIAEFMNMELLPKGEGLWYIVNKDHRIQFNENRHILQLHMMGFHENWNWLMPVVDKIEMDQWNFTKTGIYERHVEKFNGKISANGDIFVSYDDRDEFKGWFWLTSLQSWPTINIKESETRAKTRLEAVYLAVIEFIKWYNLTK
jgi:hypothetical protein